MATFLSSYQVVVHV